MGQPSRVRQRATSTTSKRASSAGSTPGYDVVEIDHGFCVSVYANDPNGILVEWCTDTKPYTEADRVAAQAAIDTAEPPLEQPPEPKFFKAPVTTPA